MAAAPPPRPPVRVHYQSATDGKSGVAPASDLSLGGVFVEARGARPAVGALVSLEIESGPTKVAVDGRVLSTSNDGFAVRFIDLPNDVAAAIGFLLEMRNPRRGTTLGLGEAEEGVAKYESARRVSAERGAERGAEAAGAATEGDEDRDTALGETASIPDDMPTVRNLVMADLPIAPPGGGGLPTPRMVPLAVSTDDGGRHATSAPPPPEPLASAPPPPGMVLPMAEPMVIPPSPAVPVFAPSQSSQASPFASVPPPVEATGGGRPLVLVLALFVFLVVAAGVLFFVLNPGD